MRGLRKVFIKEPKDFVEGVDHGSHKHVDPRAIASYIVLFSSQ